MDAGRRTSQPIGDRRRPPARLFAVAVAAVLVSAPVLTARGQPAPVIAAVELRIDQSPERWPLGRAIDFAGLVAFAPGEPLSEQAVRRTLSNFYATGLIAEAEVRTRQEATGTVAVVVLRTHTWVDSVVLEGELGLRRAVLLRVVEQEARAPLVEGRLLRSVYALQDLYATHGYRRAVVRLEVVPRPVRKQVGVVFHLESGPRATVGRLDIAGEIGPYEPAELLAAVRNQPGLPYERQRIAADRERLRAALVDRDHLTATVEAPHEDYDPQANQVHLTYPVEIGPVIEVEVRGASRKKLKKKGLLPFLGEEVYDQALVVRSREELRAWYQRQGHYRVKVETREEIGEERLELTIEIDPGSLYELAVISFTGNEHFSDEKLLELITTSTRSGLSPGRLVDEILNDDLGNLHSFYALQGFSEAEVGPTVVNVGRDKLFLAIPIREGPRRRVVTLTLPGVEALDPGAFRDQLPLRPGGPFHPVLLDDSIKLVRALYEDEGYPAITVTPRLDWNDEGTLVDVELAVGEAYREVVDRVILRGNRHTRPEVLRRFSGLQPGDPISRRRLLEAEKDLYRLGIFSRVDVERAPVSELTGRRDVLVRCDEGRRWRLSYGVSYHSGVGAGGLFSASRANLGGRGDRLQFDGRGNDRDHRFRLIFDQPLLGGRWNAPITYTLFQEREERESFAVDDLGAQIALAKELDSLRLGLVYQYRLVEPSGESFDLLEVPRELREREISSLTPTLFIDRRDDPLDPHRGWSTAVQLEYAFPWINATVELVKLFVQQTHYADLRRFGVLATSVRFGAIEPLDPDAEPDPLVPSQLPSSLVPVSERFFAGGRTTHRAYERDQLGIEGETSIDVEGDRIEVGGNGLFLLNLDYRFPITETFGGTVFFDLGNVWADWRDLDTADLKPGIGFGLRYLSLVGPVRLEVGWKLDAEPGEDDPVFFLSFGNPF
ncbi:MAG: BamA/TamA family outer membrane protein [bacterium]|nr:BamA/TamA family outer membrane protein [bacterium]